MTIKDAQQPEDAHLFKGEHEPYPFGIHGLIVPMFTPVHYTPEGFEIDTDADVRLTNFLVNGGADTLFILGNAGMFQKLTIEQKMKHVDTVIGAVAANARHIPVVVGVSAPDIGESCILARYVEDRGATAIVYVPGYGHGDPEKKTWNLLSQTKKIPLIFYHNPGIEEEGHGLDIPFLRRFIGNERVIGIKNSTKDMETYIAMCKEFTSPQFSVFMGEAANIVAARKLARERMIPDFRGGVPVQANRYIEIFANFLHGGELYSDDEIVDLIAGNNHIKTVLGDMVTDGMLDAATLDVYTQK